MIGIYKITNLITNKSYIGQSVDIEKRWKAEQRVALIESDHCYDYPLQRAFRKYGIENFSFEIIEECSVDLLNEREIYWIAQYDTFYNGYNQTLGGDTSIAKPKEHIIGIINDLENTNMYHREIAEKWNISIEMVQGINTGRYWYQANKNYPLQTQHKARSQHRENGIVQRQLYHCAKCNALITAKAQLCTKCASINSRKVERPNADDLYQYLCSVKGNFTQAGKKYGVSDNAIRKWCKAYNLPSHSKDYKI